MQSLVKIINPNLKFDDDFWHRAQSQAEKFLPDMPFSPADELEKRGYEVEFAELSVPGAAIFGRVDMEAHKVFVDLSAIDGLIDRTAVLGEKALDFAMASDMVLAHELYHILDRRRLDVTELSAVIFSLLAVEYGKDRFAVCAADEADAENGRSLESILGERDGACGQGAPADGRDDDFDGRGSWDYEAGCYTGLGSAAVLDDGKNRVSGLETGTSGWNVRLNWDYGAGRESFSGEEGNTNIW